jgi:hypothetical protein
MSNTTLTTLAAEWSPTTSWEPDGGLYAEYPETSL